MNKMARRNKFILIYGKWGKESNQGLTHLEGM
jgi:hypothetical protein